MIDPYEAVMATRERFEGMEPYMINRGRCDSFAHALAELLPGSEILDTEDFDEEYNRRGIVLPFHVWVRYEGRYYDAEAPEGVDEWSELPIFACTGFCEECHQRHEIAEPPRRREVRVRGHRRRA